jgi:hypothetical protein
MSKTNAFETDLLNHIFTNAAISDIGDASGLPAAATAGSLYISLHTADPGEAGDQTTNEVTTGAYDTYARVAVARNGTQWTVSGNSATNANEIAFPAATGGSGATVTHFGIGTSATLAGNLLYYGALTGSLAVSSGITPRFAATQLTVTED